MSVLPVSVIRCCSWQHQLWSCCNLYSIISNLYLIYYINPKGKQILEIICFGYKTEKGINLISIITQYYNLAQIPHYRVKKKYTEEDEYLKQRPENTNNVSH